MNHGLDSFDCLGSISADPLGAPGDYCWSQHLHCGCQFDETSPIRSDWETRGFRKSRQPHGKQKGIVSELHFWTRNPCSLPGLMTSLALELGCWRGEQKWESVTEICAVRTSPTPSLSMWELRDDRSWALPSLQAIEAHSLPLSGPSPQAPAHPKLGQSQVHSRLSSELCHSAAK